MQIDPVSKQLLVSNLLVNMLYGYYVSIAANCSYIFVQKFRAHSVNYLQFVSFVLMTILVTTKVVADNVTTIVAFTNPGELGEIFYPGFDAPVSYLLNAIWVAETAIADFFIIYRVWVIWHRMIWMIVLPTLLLLVTLADGIYLTYVMATLGGDLAVFFPRFNAASQTFVSLSLALNAICTGLIIYKISSVRQGVSNLLAGSSPRDPVKHIVAVLIESAAIYTIMLLVAIITKATNALVSYIAFAVLHPVIAIVFGLLIVRCASGSAAGQTHETSDAPNISGHPSGRSLYELRSRTGQQDSRLEVKLDRVVMTKVDSDGDNTLHLGSDATDRKIHTHEM